jgi:hypothetical protein
MDLNAKQLEEDGLLFEINVKVLHKYGMDLAIHNGDLVLRSNPAEGGILYSPVEWVEGAKKLTKFVFDQGGKVMKERLDLIGCLIQERPNPLVKNEEMVDMTTHPNTK